MTDPLNMIFDNFGKWLHVFVPRVDFSCLYIPQGHCFMCPLWLWSTEEYDSLILSESPPLRADHVKHNSPFHTIIIKYPKNNVLLNIT